MNMMRVTRIVAWSLIGAALVLIGILVRNLFIDDEPQPGSAAVQIGEPFALVTQGGEPITQQDLQGHPSLMFFGFTYCPDVCPTALTEVSGWLAELGADAGDIAVYFVTVDPERDVPEQLANYLSVFDPRIVGVTGPVDDVHAMLDGYHVYYQRVETEGGGYTMDHASSFYMLDDKGEFVGTIAYNEPRETALAQIRRLVAGR